MWIERLARLGFASKGFVYAIVGILAVQAAVGAGGQTTDSQGALAAIALQPFGKFLLALVALGLIGYVIWRFVEAVIDPEHNGNDIKGISKRLGAAVSGIVYASLAFSAVQLIIGSGDSSNGDATKDGTARLLAQPFGQWLVGLVGAGIIGMGFYQFYKAYSAKFRREWKLQEMSEKEETWATRISRLGIAARGVVFVVTGIFLAQAARHSNPNEARGLDGALQALAQQPYGLLILGIVALGLIAYGVYMGVQAKYRRIVAPNLPMEEAR